MKKTLYRTTLYAAVAVPMLASAFSLKDSTIGGVIGYAIEMLNLMIPILLTIAFLVFFWGMSKFILNSGSKDGIEKGKEYMLWSVLALFVLLTFRTIIGLVTSDLKLGNGHDIPYLETNVQQN